MNSIALHCHHDSNLIDILDMKNMDYQVNNNSDEITVNVINNYDLDDALLCEQFEIDYDLLEYTERV